MGGRGHSTPRVVTKHVTYREPKGKKEPVGSPPEPRALSLEDRVLRLERALGFAPTAAPPDCPLCHGTGEVNWGQPDHIRGKVGKCLCRMTPDERRRFGR